MNRGMLTQPIEVLPYEEGERDRYNDVTPSFGDPVSYRGYLEQTAATEIVVDRDTLVSSWLLILPPHAELTAKDHVVSGVKTYEVVGEPWRVRDPMTRRTDHVEARLELIDEGTAEESS